MTVKHTLVSLDMRVFALCSLMELHRGAVLDGSQTERDVPERCLRVVPFYLFAGAARSFGARRAAKSSG